MSVTGPAQSAVDWVNPVNWGPWGPLAVTQGWPQVCHVGRRWEGTPASPYTAASLGRGRNSATGVRFTRAWSRSNGQDDPRRMVVVVRPEMAGNGIGGELSGGRSSGLHGHGDGRHGKARRGALRGPGSARSTRGPSVRAEELGVREDEGGAGGAWPTRARGRGARGRRPCGRACVARRGGARLGAPERERGGGDREERGRATEAGGLTEGCRVTAVGSRGRRGRRRCGVEAQAGEEEEAGRRGSAPARRGRGVERDGDGLLLDPDRGGR